MRKEWKAARQKGGLAAPREMLVAGSDVDARDEHGQTALMLAAREGQHEVVALALEYGASLDKTAKYHLSALMLATINDHQGVVRLLLAGGANPDLRGSGAPGFDGQTALNLARDLDRPAIAELLSQ